MSRTARRAVETEWHNYKSARTGKLAGSYLYLPNISDRNLAHVYQPIGASGWYVQCFVRGTALSGYIAASLDDAKRRVAAHLISYAQGQSDLFIDNPL